MFRLQILLLALLSASAPAGIHAHADQTVDGVALRPSGDVPDERDSLEQLTGRLDTLVRTSLNELYLNIDGRCEVRRLNANDKEFDPHPVSPLSNHGPGRE